MVRWVIWDGTSLADRLPTMPRTTHTLHRVERPGRTPYWQAWVGGKPRYLGTSKRTAEKHLRQLLAEAPTPDVSTPRTISGLIAAFNATHEVKITEWAAAASLTDLLAGGGETEASGKLKTAAAH